MKKLLIVALGLFSLTSAAFTASLELKNNWSGTKPLQQDIIIYSYGKIIEYDWLLQINNDITNHGLKVTNTLSKDIFAIGLSQNSNAQECAIIGLQNFCNIKKFNFYAELKNYLSIGKVKTVNYMDLFSCTEYQWWSRVYIGCDIDIVNYWEKNIEDEYMLRPIVGIRLTENFNIYTKYSRVWSGHSKTDALCLGTKINF